MPESRNSGVRVEFIARQRLGKQVPAEMNTDATVVSMQRRGIHTTITVDELLGNAVFSWVHLSRAGGVVGGVVEWSDVK
jgi:hypothetical protein